MSEPDENPGNLTEQAFTRAGAGLDVALQEIEQLRSGPAGAARGTRTLLSETGRRITAALLWLRTAHASYQRGPAGPAVGQQFPAGVCGDRSSPC